MAQSAPQITFIEQNAPIDEYGRALYAVCRSIFRALIDSVTDEDLSDVNTALHQLSMRAFAKIARLDRDKGMRGDGFEWAVHEAILGQEPSVAEPISQAMRRAPLNSLAIARLTRFYLVKSELSSSDF